LPFSRKNVKYKIIPEITNKVLKSVAALLKFLNRRKKCIDICIFEESGSGVHHKIIKFLECREKIFED